MFYLLGIDKPLFGSGSPEWDKCCAGDLSNFPAIQWKLRNIRTLKDTNPSKFNEGINKLRKITS